MKSEKPASGRDIQRRHGQGKFLRGDTTRRVEIVPQKFDAGTCPALSCPGDGDHKGIQIITRATSKQKGTTANAVNPFRSAHCELRYPGEGLPQLPAVEVFRKRDQLVGIVHHLPVDGTGADHPLFTALFELVTVQTQHLADLAGREEHRAVAVAQQVFEEQ